MPTLAIEQYVPAASSTYAPDLPKGATVRCDTVMTSVLPMPPTNEDFLYLGFPEDKLPLLDLVTHDVRVAVYEDCLRTLMEQLD